MEKPVCSSHLSLNACCIVLCKVFRSFKSESDDLSWNEKCHMIFFLNPDVESIFRCLNLTFFFDSAQKVDSSKNHILEILGWKKSPSNCQILTDLDKLLLKGEYHLFFKWIFLSSVRKNWFISKLQDNLRTRCG